MWINKNANTSTIKEKENWPRLFLSHILTLWLNSFPSLQPSCNVVILFFTIITQRQKETSHCGNRKLILMISSDQVNSVQGGWGGTLAKLHHHLRSPWQPLNTLTLSSPPGPLSSTVSLPGPVTELIWLLRSNLWDRDYQPLLSSP